MSAWPLVAVLVINFNGRKHLKRCFDSLLNTEYPDFKLFLIDNNSTDGSVTFIKRFYPQVTIISHKTNYGFCKGYNEAVKKNKKYEYLVFLNNDVEVDKNWLKEMVKYTFEEKVAIVTSKLKFLDNKEVINAAGGMCDLFGVGWNRGNGEKDRGQYNKAEEVLYGIGAALLIKRKIFEEVGGFDEDYFAYAEDLDLGWRVRLAGYKVVYVPTSIIYHKWTGSWTNLPYLVYFLERNCLMTILKNYSIRSLLPLALGYAIVKISKIFWLLIRGKRILALAVIKAILNVLFRLKKVWKKKAKIQILRRVSDREIKKYMYKASYEIRLCINHSHPFIFKINEWKR